MKKIFMLIGGLVFLILVAAVFFYFSYMQPIKGMQPTGEYNVGVTNFDHQFASEISGADRKLNIKAWYPTHSTDGELDLLQTPQIAQQVVKVWKMPGFLTVSDNSHSYINAPIANDEAPYPVIIFNHGFTSFHTQNTINMQELASHGYIVMSIAHPGISLVTEYTDGTSVKYDATHPAFVAFDKQAENLADAGKQIGFILDQVKDSADFDAYWQQVNKFADIEAYAGFQGLIKQWIEDTNQVIGLIASDQAAKLSPLIAKQISTDKIATFGHSLGGVVSTFTNMSNQHIIASISLDAPPLYATSLDGLNVNKSTCHLMSDIIDMGGNKLDFRGINRPLLEKSTKFGCNAIFKNAAHMSFSDLNYVAAVKLAGVIGSVDQQKMGEELNNMILWYFDKTLKNIDEQFKAKHSEIVELETFNQ